MRVLFCVAIATLVLSQPAWASPSINASVTGSVVNFTAQNSADREFGCTINWSISYSEYGSGKSKSNSKTIVVGAKANGIVMQDQTTYANLQLTSFNYKCS